MKKFAALFLIAICFVGFGCAKNKKITQPEGEYITVAPTKPTTVPLNAGYCIQLHNQNEVVLKKICYTNFRVYETTEEFVLKLNLNQNQKK